MDLVEEFVRDSREPDDTIDEAWMLLCRAWGTHAESDEILARHARRWELSRLALVDRNILRMAAYELLSRTAPPKVIISEALRLAREFSTAESPRFVNGVLDAVLRELAGHPPQEPHEHPEPPPATPGAQVRPHDESEPETDDAQGD